MTDSRPAILIAVAAPLLLSACGLGHESAAGSPSPAAATSTPRPSGRQAPQDGLAGTVVSAAAGQITVRDRASGKDVKVSLDAGVPINSRGGTASASDLKPGVMVLVRGQTSADGTVHPTAITLAAPGAVPSPS